MRETHKMQFTEADLSDPELGSVLEGLMAHPGVMWTTRGNPPVITFWWRDEEEAS